MKKFIIALGTLAISFALFSFTVKKINNDFLKQLGMTQSQADEKITHSMLGGYLDTYGLKNAKNIALGNRAAVVSDLLHYTKKHIASPAFKKEYAALKDKNKPKPYVVQTPDEMRAQNIAALKKSIVDLEGYQKKSDASMKAMYDKSIADAKKMLADAEDPNNKAIVNYTKNYPKILKDNESYYERDLKKWEAQYPTDPIQFVKVRLQKFMTETEGIDYAAELITKNNKKVFVNPDYERKSNYWKMAFRAGKEVTETARTFVGTWLAEIE